MGTTLTGTTPQDTYDSLIKVTDNGPLSGTLKKLTDGLGNDSSLSLSTAAASLSGTLAVTGASTFSSALTAATESEFTGTATNSRVLVTAAGVANTILGFNNSGSTTNGVVNNAGFIGVIQSYPFVFTTADTERMRITATGIVGIGTSTPSAAAASYGGLDIRGASGGGVRYGVEGGFNMLTYATGTATDFVPSAASDIRFFNKTGITESIRFQSAGGISFNGDTAQANALDDYEEGTWTMGISFGGASVGVTTSVNSGTYTKIGRQVTVNGYLILTSKGSSVGDAQITGLPFTIGASNGYYSAASLRLLDISFANQFQAIGIVNTTGVALQEITEAGVSSSITDSDFQDTSRVIISLTYFV